MIQIIKINSRYARVENLVLIYKVQIYSLLGCPRRHPRHQFGGWERDTCLGN